MSTHNPSATTRNKKTRSKKRCDRDSSSTGPSFDSQQAMLDSNPEVIYPPAPLGEAAFQHRINKSQMVIRAGSGTAPHGTMPSQKSLGSDSSNSGLRLHPQQLVHDSRHRVGDPSTPLDKAAQFDQASSTDPKCYLLDIAGELRNRIYREVLVSSQHISVTPTGFHTNGISLLNTCKQIRSETLGIFYYENIFSFQVQDFNPDAIITFVNLLAQVRIKPEKVRHCFSMIAPRPCWKNLLRWLKATHRGHVSGLHRLETMRLTGDCSLDKHIVVAMFNAVSALREQNVPWNAAETLVEKMRISLETFDLWWAEN